MFNDCRRTELLFAWKYFLITFIIPAIYCTNHVSFKFTCTEIHFSENFVRMSLSGCVLSDSTFPQLRSFKNKHFTRR
jgi:hypothetical protein